MTTALPDGWTEQYLGDYAVILDNLRMPLSSMQRSSRRGPFPYCGANGVLDFIDDFMIDDDVVLLAEDGGNFDQWRTRPIAYRMKGKIWVNNHAHVLKAGERGCTGFLFYALQHKDITSLISSGTRSKLTRAELVRIKFAIPGSIGEQRLISDALTTVDDFITSLERLIAKKQSIKQGMMQRLLTGETRLPGHNGTWSVGPLKNFMPLQRGFDLPSSLRRQGLVPVVYSNGVAQFHSVAMVKGPGVVTGRSGTIGKVHYVDSDYWPHNTSLWVTSFERVRPRFAYHLLSFLQLDRFSSGSGVPTLNRNDVHGFEISLPSDLVEQDAIAAALDAIDAELETLERNVASTFRIKQGMMQELLTGRTRLAPMEVSA
ncbi:MAG: restriction endonuclease subunit S [Microbacteriaceae bacterium]|nr:restriction endonuclease subunit S [Microbacteriaceae bacterium]